MTRSTRGLSATAEFLVILEPSGATIRSKLTHRYFRRRSCVLNFAAIGLPAWVSYWLKLSPVARKILYLFLSNKRNFVTAEKLHHRHWVWVLKIWGCSVSPDPLHFSCEILFACCIPKTGCVTTDARYWYRNYVCPPVRPSVCPSVVNVPVLGENGLTYCQFFSPYGSPITLVLSAWNIFTKFRRCHPPVGALNTGRV